MDNLLLHSSKQPFEISGRFVEPLLKSGLEISPRKYQLFTTELQYMGNTIFFIKDKRLYIKPLKSRLEAIQKLKLPKTAKEYVICRSSKY